LAVVDSCEVGNPGPLGMTERVLLRPVSIA
jgi:hypothetical protein